MVESEHCVEKVISKDSEVNRNQFMQILAKMTKMNNINFAAILCTNLPITNEW